MSDRQPTSSWQRHNKVKYNYSPLYQMWREAVTKHGAGSDAAQVLTCRHAKSMGVKNAACEKD